MLNQLLTKLERKFGRFAIPHLMSIILVGMVVMAIEIVRRQLSRIRMVTEKNAKLVVILKSVCVKKVEFILCQ